MSQDDVERVARAILPIIMAQVTGRAPRETYDTTIEENREAARDVARAAISAMPGRVSPELIAQLNKLASRLTAQGEYEAVDLIDTVVARVSAMPGRELLAEAMEALALVIEQSQDHVVSKRGVVSTYEDDHGEKLWFTTDDAICRARAAADKIRAAMGGEKS